MGFKWPKGMKEVHYLDRLEGKKAIFKDGTEQNAFCSVPSLKIAFLPSSLSR